MTMMADTKLVARLTVQARCFRNRQFRRIHNFRAKPHTKQQKETTKTNCWDLPIVVVTCASRKFPKIIGNGRNCSRLRNPAPVVRNAYASIIDKSGNPMKGVSIPLGTAPSSQLKNLFGYSTQTGNEAGRCAEPHAAHNLSGNLSPKHSVNLSDIVFSLAIEVSTSAVKPYCATCKIAFPQLR